MSSGSENDIVAIISGLIVNGYFSDLPASDRLYFIKRLRDRKEDYLSFPRYCADDPYRGKYTPADQKVDYFFVPLQLTPSYAGVNLDFLFQCRHPESKICLSAIDVNSLHGSTRIKLTDLSQLPYLNDLIQKPATMQNHPRIPRRSQQRGKRVRAIGQFFKKYRSTAK